EDVRKGVTLLAIVRAGRAARAKSRGGTGAAAEGGAWEQSVECGYAAPGDIRKAQNSIQILSRIGVEFRSGGVAETPARVAEPDVVEHGGGDGMRVGQHGLLRVAVLRCIRGRADQRELALDDGRGRVTKVHPVFFGNDLIDARGVALFVLPQYARCEQVRD